MKYPEESTAVAVPTLLPPSTGIGALVPRFWTGFIDTVAAKQTPQGPVQVSQQVTKENENEP